MKINLDKGSEFIISTLYENGFEAYAVGGCVRDSLMGKIPSDIDICTSALPEKAFDIFESIGLKTFKTGIRHGTITVLYEDIPYEITTYRVDGDYLDSRHPENVKFVRNLREDLARRDFTINAMAYNSKVGLIDLFGGLYDIKNKVIRTVENPNQRFSEDALRILRCLRFSSVLGFEIEAETANSAIKLKDSLNNISAERINIELNKLLCGKNAEYILMNYTDILAVFIPEIKPMIGFKQNNIHHIYDIWQHTVKAVINAPADTTLRLTMLFHDIGKPECYTIEKDNMGHFYGHADISADMASKILHRLKYDNETIHTVTKLIHYHDIQLNATEKSVKKLLNKLGELLFNLLMEVKKADTLGLNPDYHNERFNFFAEIVAIKNKILSENQCFSLKDLAVKGGDIINIGIEPGPKIGIILNEILELTLENNLPNNKDKILDYIKNNY